MCGIFAVVKKAGQRVKPEEVQRPVALLSHRGPDGAGFYVDQNVGLAHHRLAIFDLSENGKQPLSALGLFIVFNGAIYNFPELKDELQQAGYTFRTSTDTEVILTAYHAWGTSCVERFNGQWAFIIYDARKHQLFCSRDRFGIKPFYYTKIDGNWYFASEIKAFTAVPSWQARMNPVCTYDYLNSGITDHSEETFFAEVYPLPKGTNLLMDTETLSSQFSRYYSLSSTEPDLRNDHQLIEQFSDLLSNSIQLRLRSDVPVGAALSGGLDSSSLVLTMRKIHPQGNLHTFSVIFDEEDISERKYVEAVLRKAQIQSTVISPTYDDFIQDSRRLIWQQEEPFGGLSIYAQYSLFRSAAAAGIKVMIDGQGADEILGGYEKFYIGLLRSNRHKPVQAIQQLVQIIGKHQFAGKALKRAFERYVLKRKEGISPWLRLQTPASEIFQWPHEPDIQAMSINMIEATVLPALLRYEDKNAMAFGIESRVPFLDHRLVEFCLSLPDELKIHKGIRKWILRESRKHLLPDSIYTRYDKLGFATPEEKWLKSQRIQLVRYLQEDSTLLFKDLIDVQKLGAVKDNKVLLRMYLFDSWIKCFEVGH